MTFLFLTSSVSLEMGFGDKEMMKLEGRPPLSWHPKKWRKFGVAARLLWLSTSG